MKQKGGIKLSDIVKDRTLSVYGLICSTELNRTETEMPFSVLNKDRNSVKGKKHP
uniref:Uncharacterized protein n=1 Tax=Lepeophtheirus salmonis TaxID=72036 RepID=A0A0K2UVP1_LEPSM